MAERRRLEIQQGDGCGCDVRPIVSHFDAKVRNSGGPPALHATTRGLLALLGEPKGRTVLELGCGQGGLLQTVLESGATSVTGVDVSPASIEAARRRVAGAGFAQRARLEIGDAATAGLEPHDWVVLDRVICCYPDAAGLIRNSASAARRRYAFAVPASRGFRGTVARVGWTVDNFLDRFRRCGCPRFVHDLDGIERTLERMGFERLGHTTWRTWYLAVFERRDG